MTAPSASPAESAPVHAPRLCRDCNAPIFWAQVLDDRGQRVPRDGAKGWKAIPVDAQPDPDGTVILFHREGEGIVARILRRREDAPAGAKLRRSHWPRCRKNARRR